MTEPIAPHAPNSETSAPLRAYWLDAASEFATSPLAVGALMVLAVIITGAIFAPWLSPQNPYDLNVIDVREGRLPPGSTKMSKLHSITARIHVAPDGEEATLTSSRNEDQALIDDITLTSTMSGATLILSFQFEQASELTPLHTITISGLPRGSEIVQGAKDKFRSRWSVAPQDASRIEMVLPQTPRRALKLRLTLTGGAQQALMSYWLGTDAQGRDMLSAILYGLRISLAVAVTSVLIALTFGTIAGLYAAYMGGRTDSTIMRVVDLQLSFPTILVALILLALLGKGVGNVMLALIIVQWAFYARTARGAALSEASKEYMEACRCLALPRSRIILRHLLPNCLPPLIVVATLQVAGAISLEATLSFLGLGLPVTQPSLGLLIANGFEYLLSGYPWISVIPGVALLVTVVSINLVGDELRDILNPRLKR